MLQKMVYEAAMNMSNKMWMIEGWPLEMFWKIYILFLYSIEYVFSCYLHVRP